jgi:hypothetical protein
VANLVARNVNEAVVVVVVVVMVIELNEVWSLELSRRFVLVRLVGFSKREIVIRKV